MYRLLSDRNDRLTSIFDIFCVTCSHCALQFTLIPFFQINIWRIDLHPGKTTCYLQLEVFQNSCITKRQRCCSPIVCWGREFYSHTFICPIHFNIQNTWFKQIFLLEDDVNCGLTIYCSASAEAMCSNPVEVPKFFSDLFAIA